MTSHPLIAIVGHPNEGKSSVLSTLTEDDSVVVSDFPGDTIRCQRFPVVINGETVLEFVDTPGFQNPRRVLAFMQEAQLTDEALLKHFVQEFSGREDFSHDRELMLPLLEGAGLIYVVDCSRPLLDVDIAEMEILRLINKPRMAVINFKEEDSTYLEDWKQAFRRHFNVIREFNAHHARFSERIQLLETLKAIHQDWEPALEKAVLAFKDDWLYRRRRVAEATVLYLEEVINYRHEKNCSPKLSESDIKQQAGDDYREAISERESRLFGELKRLYRHQVFNFELPSHSLLQEDLFSERTWQILGLTQKQILVASAGMGAGLGAALDVAAHGLSFGVFTAAGALGASGLTWLKGQDLANTRVMKMPLGGSRVVIGPNRNPQFPFIVLERALLFYREILNHAHGNRTPILNTSNEGSLLKQMPAGDHKVLMKAFRKLSAKQVVRREEGREKLLDYLNRHLQDL